MLKSNVKLICFYGMGIVSLFAGFLIYLLFRENAYISKLFSEVQFVEILREKSSDFENDFLKYYLVDYLWAVSFSCGLHIIFFPKMKGSILCSIVVFVVAATFEIFQKIGIIGGTGDLTDIFLYLLACITVNIVNTIKG